jgi:hypothetical protein
MGARDGVATLTCIQCLGGDHMRCGTPRHCACSICTTPGPKSRFIRPARPKTRSLNGRASGDSRIKRPGSGKSGPAPMSKAEEAEIVAMVRRLATAVLREHVDGTA